VVLGPPGGGKGTLAEHLAEHLGVPHISTGDILRAEVANASALGRRAHHYMTAGQLVPDELVTEISRRRLTAPDALDGWILDGFPRDLNQAESLAAALGRAGPEAVFALEVPDQEVIVRIAGRLTCPRGHVYNAEKDPPRRPGICDIDGEPLGRREDASPAVIEERMAIYKRETTPVLDYYERERLLHRVDGLGERDEIYERVLARLGSS